MLSLRIDRASPGETAREAVTLDVDGRLIQAYPGETIAAALFASGVRTLRTSPRNAEPRGVFCMIGSCQECLVKVDGRRRLACQVVVGDGMRVVTAASDTCLRSRLR